VCFSPLPSPSLSTPSPPIHYLFRSPPFHFMSHHHHHHHFRSRFYKWVKTCSIWLFELGLSHSTWWSQFHPFSSKCHSSIFLYGCLIFHNIYTFIYILDICTSIYICLYTHISYFLYPFVGCWAPCWFYSLII
jgi:hypothetical protein